MKLNYAIAFLMLVVFLVLFFITREEFKMPHNHKNHELDTSKKNPCTDYLTDMEYLEHMIPHHVVAADMSKELIKTSRNPIMLALPRNIIRHQSYEVWEMRRMMANLETDNMFLKKTYLNQNKKKLSLNLLITNL